MFHKLTVPKELKKDLPFKTKMKNQQKQIAGVNKATRVPVLREEKDKKASQNWWLKKSNILGGESVQHSRSSSKRTKRETKSRFKGANGKVQGVDPEATAQATATEQRFEEKDLFESAERSVKMIELINLKRSQFWRLEKRKMSHLRILNLF